jgi:hypothetical protein
MGLLSEKDAKIVGEKLSRLPRPEAAVDMVLSASRGPGTA